MSNRQIKFRVRKAKPSKGWAYFSIPHKIIWEGVWDLETLGQFTGLTDAKGQEIYESDLLRLGADGFSPHDIVEVTWDKTIQGWLPRVAENTNWVVVGNRYENPDLLPDTNTPQGNER